MPDEMTPDLPDSPDVIVGDVKPQGDPLPYEEVVQEGMDVEMPNESPHNDNPDDTLGFTPQQGESETPDLDALIRAEEQARKDALEALQTGTMESRE